MKLRGYRIELGEIETVLHQYPGIQTAVVKVRADRSGVERLVAYLLADREPSFAIANLQRFLRSQLPEYLVPSVFVQLETLPLTPNGKIDYAALPDSNQSDNASRSDSEQPFAEPRTAIEADLVDLWQQILNREQIGIQDSFFDLGGDSLLAIRLMDLIHQKFAQELPLSSLFINPTVAGLAIALNPNEPLQGSPLVPLQPKGSKPAFFCVHPIFGVVLPYHALAQQMGLDQPFYGLQPIGIDGKQPPHTQIEEMAAYYIKAIRQVQPQGPYFLGGWSFGGLVAFEMAQQLHQAGHRVALLAVIDTPAPVLSNKPTFWKSCEFLLTTVMRSIWAFLLDYLSLIATSYPFNPKLRQTKFPTTWRALLERAAIVGLLPQDSKIRLLNELTLRPLLQVFSANNQAVQRYVPRRYPDRITLFRTPLLSAKNLSDTTMGWNQLTETTVEVHQVPGNHLTMLRNPQVEVLAQQLQACICMRE